ncbi:hypothetical protein ACYSNR_04965 [Enterococcus sp. LJL128]|uniref:hypothetical protein n=1 Tax=Enterococcus sp. LJL51 TaxID=3416656 RepID=UPI003CF67659
MRGKGVSLFRLLVAAVLLVIVGKIIIDNYQKEQEQKEQAKIEQLTIEEVERVKAASDLGLDFFSTSTVSEEEAGQYGIDQPEMAFTEDQQVKGYYFSYPKEEKTTRLTQIVISSPSYHLFGLRVGDSMENLEVAMGKQGYKMLEPEEDGSLKFQKYEVYIQFEPGAEAPVVEEITCYLPMPFEEGIVY